RWARGCASPPRGGFGVVGKESHSRLTPAATEVPPGRGMVRLGENRLQIEKLTGRLALFIVCRGWCCGPREAAEAVRRACRKAAARGPDESSVPVDRQPTGRSEAMSGHVWDDAFGGGGVRFAHPTGSVPVPLARLPAHRP